VQKLSNVATVDIENKNMSVWHQAHVCHLKPVPFRGVNCSDAAGRQLGYSRIMSKANQSFTGILWDDIAQSPYASYKVNAVMLCISSILPGSTGWNS